MRWLRLLAAAQHLRQVACRRCTPSRCSGGPRCWPISSVSTMQRFAAASRACPRGWNMSTKRASRASCGRMHLDREQRARRSPRLRRGAIDLGHAAARDQARAEVLAERRRIVRRARAQLADWDGRSEPSADLTIYQLSFCPRAALDRRSRPVFSLRAVVALVGDGVLAFRDARPRPTARRPCRRRARAPTGRAWC